MKFNILFKTVLLIFVIVNTIISQTKSMSPSIYYKVSEVRIFINNKSDIVELQKEGLGFDHIKVYNNYFDVILDSLQISKLEKTSYRFNILIEDVTKDYLKRTKLSREKLKLSKSNKTSVFGYGSMGGFYTFDEVVAQLDTMKLLYPNLITKKDSIGSSIEGRTIWAVKISDNPDINEDEPQVFYNSLIHAREPEGMETVIYFMYYLLENYGKDPEVTYLVNNRELYFVPVINPDGYVYNEQLSPDGGGQWRKNRRDDGGGTFGVDLNRNFGYKWGYDDIGSSPDSTSLDYRGVKAFSEPETRAIRDFCINHNFKVAVNYHTFSNIVVPPWGYEEKQSIDSTTFNNLIFLASTLNNYKNIWPYAHNGNAVDWMYGDVTSVKNKIIRSYPGSWFLVFGRLRKK